jgi:hypothetical protein
MNLLLFLTLIVLFKCAYDAAISPRSHSSQIVNGILAVAALVVLVLQVT